MIKFLYTWESIDITIFIPKVDFHFFSQKGWKNFRWGESHMKYGIFDASGGT